MATEDLKKRAEYTKVAGVLLGFAFLCLLTSFFLNMDAGSSIKQFIPLTGGDIGPIEVKADYSVYLITVKQTIQSYGTWSFVGGDVLNEKKEYLFGFGKELWKERGVDYEGYSWAEEETSYDLKVTFPQKGIYFLHFNIETNNSSSARSVQVEVAPKRGSSLAHFILGILAFFGSIGVWMWVNANLAPTDRLFGDHDDDD